MSTLNDSWRQQTKIIPRTEARSDMRSPLAKARDRWIDSADGKECSNPLTLKTTADQRQYLENRLVRAFLAGADWMERQKQKRKRPTKR